MDTFLKGTPNEKLCPRIPFTTRFENKLLVTRHEGYSLLTVLVTTPKDSSILDRVSWVSDKTSMDDVMIALECMVS